MRIHALPFIFVAALAAGSAQAEGEGRYRMEKTDGGFVRLSLVAEQGRRVVGHILFSDLAIITQDGTMPALALAPPGT